MNYEVLLYYKFVPIEDTESVRKEHFTRCEELGLLGRILIAPEGINGTVSGLRSACEAYRAYMNEHPLFQHIEFKISPHASHAFHKLHVRTKNELVNFSAPDAPSVWNLTAPYIEPDEMKRVLETEDPDVYIFDARSKFEFDVGRFKNAQIIDIQHFRELPQKLEEIAHLKDKKIITYCTGGIRCEKLTGLMILNGFKNVYQLHGGIIRYADETGGVDFEGQCYVFDNRVVQTVNVENPSVVGACKLCGTATEKMINCANAACNEHYLVCDKCAEEMLGCCTKECLDSPQRRLWDGTGQYHRGINSKNYVPV